MAILNLIDYSNSKTEDVLMSLLFTIILGFVVGLFARGLMPGRDAMGFIMTTLLGIGGAVLARYVGLAVGLYERDQNAGFFMSLIGAMILLFLYNHFKSRKA